MSGDILPDAFLPRERLTAAKLERLRQATARALDRAIHLNVKADFGAKGDGITNDTAAFAAASAAAAQEVGVEYYGSRRPVIYFPPGNYRGVIDIPFGSGMVGDGPSAVTIAPPPGANRPVVLCQAPTEALGFVRMRYLHTVLRGFAVNGYGNAQSGSIAHGIEVEDTPFFFSGDTYCAGVIARDLRVTGCRNTGLRIGANRNASVIMGVTVDGGATALQTFSYDNFLIGNAFGGAQYGWRIEAGGANDAHSNTVYSCSEAGVVKSTHAGGYNTIVGGSIGGHQKHGVYAQRNNDGLPDSADLLILEGVDLGENSRAGDGLYSQIMLVDGANISVSGGRFARGSSTATRGKYLVEASGTGNAVVYWDNPAYDTTGDGVAYATALFGGALDIRGPYRRRQSGGITYRRFDEFLEITAKMRWQADAAAADMRAWIMQAGNNYWNMAAIRDNEDAPAVALTIKRTVDGSGNPVISSVQIGGALWAAPPPYANNTAARVLLPPDHIYWNTTTGVYARTT